MSFDPQIPHNDLPPLPPHEVVESLEVLRAAMGARLALTELNLTARFIPNPEVLITALPVAEVQASSAIENIVTTSDALFRTMAQGGWSTDPATREAMRYRQALRDGFEAMASRPFSLATARAVCSAVVGHDTDFRSNSGTFIGNPASGEVRYTPPSGRVAIQELLGNWESYIHTRDEVDPVVRLAIAHYQFEAIHPFPDGNGRSGRIINLLLLAEWGLLPNPILYLSTYFLATRSDYYDRLLGVTARGEWREWILYFVAGVEQTARVATATIERIVGARHNVSDAIHREFGRDNPALLAAIFTQPYTRIADVVAGCEVSRPTATIWLDRLESVGVLRSVRVGRDKLFVNLPFAEALQLTISS